MHTLAELGVILLMFGLGLEDHAQAGAELIVAALARQMATEPTASASVEGQHALPDHKMREDEEREDEQLLSQVQRALPGLGDPVSVRLWRDSPAVRRTLAELNLRGLTGATVLATTREGQRVVIPTGHEVLHDGDVLAVAGTQNAIAAAVRLLRSGD